MTPRGLTQRWVVVLLVVGVMRPDLIVWIGGLAAFGWLTLLGYEVVRWLWRPKARRG